MTAGLARGFKSRAVWIADRVRRRLGIGNHDPVDVFGLAELYDIDVEPLSSVGCPDEVVGHFHGDASARLSGFALLVDERHLVVYNDGHAIERIRSTMTHEVSHVVLQHEPVLRVAREKGCNAPDSDQELEAAELGGELLIPQRVAKQAVLDGREVEAVADQFLTSLDIARWRMNVSGGYQVRKHIGSR